MAFTGIIASIVAGSVDMEASALNVSAERAQKIDFTIPIASTTNAVMKLKENANVKSSKIEDLAGLKCAVKQTTQPEQMMQAMNEELKAKGAQPGRTHELRYRGADCCGHGRQTDRLRVDDKIVLAQAMKAQRMSRWRSSGRSAKSHIAWGLNKNNPKLTGALNDGIQKLKASGKLAELQNKHFGFTMDDLPEADYIPAQ